jgi:glycosyltransferase involved in cell wall biosynthesis
MAQPAPTKVPMTGLIVSHNEGHLIGDRLGELAFCDELIVVDVASTDDTAAVAEAHGARVIPHPFARIAELVHPGVVDQARNDLVVIPDPDEEIPPALARQVAELPGTLADDVAIVVVPRIFYFRGRPLRGTIWGGTSGGKPLVISRSRAEFIPAVHHGMKPRPGYRWEKIEWDGQNAMRHYWASGYREFLHKHVRYIRIEGPARALVGEITGYRALVHTPHTSFRQSFIERKGYLDGVHGFLLSALYALYRTGSDLALIRHLRRGRAPV